MGREVKTPPGLARIRSLASKTQNSRTLKFGTCQNLAGSRFYNPVRQAPQRGAADLIEGGQRPVRPRFGSWRSGTSLVLMGGCMRGRCEDAIVDQLVLGRSWQFFSTALKTLAPKSTKNQRKGNQNDAHECCEMDLAKRLVPGSRRGGAYSTVLCFFGTFWRHLVDFGDHFGPTWRQRVAQGVKMEPQIGKKSMPKSMQALMPKKYRQMR